MSKQFDKSDLLYSNSPFWWLYIIGMRGYDDESDLNLYDVIKSTIPTPNHKHIYDEIYSSDPADNDGMYDNPKFIAGKIANELTYAIEFHKYETIYFLNDIFIGNSGGHFIAWFLTLDELIAFDKYDTLFMLLLPMAGVEEAYRKKAENLVEAHLELIPIFSGKAGYIAKSIVNGLIIKDGFTYKDCIGITNKQNHSVRNVDKYPQYRDDVKVLNAALKTFIKK